eukprot:1335122-Amphidinium_carterae.1
MPKNGKKAKNGNRPFFKKIPLVAVFFVLPYPKLRANAHGRPVLSSGPWPSERLQTYLAAHAAGRQVVAS